MLKGKSPKKKSGQQVADKGPTIIDFFKKQHVKAKLQKQSEQNWAESMRESSTPGNTNVSNSNEDSNVSRFFSTAFNDDIPSSVKQNLMSLPSDKGRLTLKRKLEVNEEGAKTNIGTSEEPASPKAGTSKIKNIKERKYTCTSMESPLDIDDSRSNTQVAFSCRDEIGEKDGDLEETKTRENPFIEGFESMDSNLEESNSSLDNKGVHVTLRTEESVTNDETDSTTVDDYRVPYYLENFVFILNAIINDDFYAYLFNEEDRHTISIFRNLSDEAQKLYVRLFGRIHRWLRKSKILYPKIASDLTDALGELCESNLLMPESEMDSLEEVLKSLPAPDVKTVAKSLKLSASLVREEAIEAILKHTNTSNIGSFFAVKKGKGAVPGHSGIKRSVLNRSKKLLGNCYKLRKEQRSVFMRMLMLFSLHNTRLEDSERDTGQQQIFQMLMSNIGRVKYPEYKINRATKIFMDRENLISFTAALQVETDIHVALEKKDFKEALNIYHSAVDYSKALYGDKDVHSYDESLPKFLRSYTTGAVYVRILSYGVELMQYTKRYEEAVTQLQQLIQQQLYHLDYRGRWCERLALNLDFHLKKPEMALDVIKHSLEDNNIRKGHRYALFQRAQKICSTASNKLKQRWKEFEEDVMNCVQKAPEVFIQARKQEVPGEFPIFISEDSYTADNQHMTFMKRVEDVALKHYEKLGFAQGIHGEGGTLTFFYGLFMWDIIFMDSIPDVFYNQYQTHPLDYYSEHYYETRKDKIDSRLRVIRESTDEELDQMLRSAWTNHQDTFCIGVNWEMYEDVEHASGLLQCIGGTHLAAILERFATDMRFTRSGLPDLTVWNPETKKFKLVEVKGPGDRLSTKQILWLDYFLAIGVDAEVCYVKAVGVKKLK